MITPETPETAPETAEVTAPHMEIPPHRIADVIRSARRGHQVQRHELISLADLIADYFEALDAFDAVVGTNDPGLRRAKAASRRLGEADRALRAAIDSSDAVWNARKETP